MTMRRPHDPGGADFIERRWLADCPEPAAALMDARGELHARGATWLRAHVRPVTRQLIVEGWRVRPEREGDLPY